MPSQAATNSWRKTQKGVTHNHNPNFSKALQILKKKGNKSVLTPAGHLRMAGVNFTTIVNPSSSIQVQPNPFNAGVYDKGTILLKISGYTSKPDVIIEKSASKTTTPLLGRVKVTINGKEVWVLPETVFRFDRTKNGAKGDQIKIDNVNSGYKSGGRIRRSKTHRKRK
jgi:hypothetical protein